MLTMEEWLDLKPFSVQGHSIRAIAEMNGLSRNTVRRGSVKKTPQEFAKPKRKSRLEEYKAYVEKRYNECALSAVRLEEEIRGKHCSPRRISLRHSAAVAIVTVIWIVLSGPIMLCSGGLNYGAVSVSPLLAQRESLFRKRWP